MLVIVCSFVKIRKAMRGYSAAAALNGTPQYWQNVASAEDVLPHREQTCSSVALFTDPFLCRRSLIAGSLNRDFLLSLVTISCDGWFFSGGVLSVVAG